MPQEISAEQQAILKLLHQSQQLTTKEVWQQLHADRTHRYTARELRRMEKKRLIKALVQGASPANVGPVERRGRICYWTLLKAGADAIDATFGNHFYRQRPASQVAYRQMLLELERQVVAAGWRFIAPVHYSARRPKPALTPQALYLMDAIEACERYNIEQDQGDPASNRQRLQERLVRLQSGKIRELVPRGCNDYVIYQPGQLVSVAILAPEPPTASALFWTRKRAAVSQAKKPPPAGRLTLYGPLMEIIPMAAVFMREPTHSLKATIEQAAGYVLASHEIGDFIAELMI